MDSERIRELQREISAEAERMRRCRHEYGEPYYDPYAAMEAYGVKLVTQGSDCWTEPQGYHEVTKARWTRRCKRCGFEEHTERQRPIVRGHEPDFGGGR